MMIYSASRSSSSSSSSFPPFHLSSKILNQLRGPGLARIVKCKLRKSFKPIICLTGFRPCIDIHKGKVKQIIGSSLKDNNEGDSSLITNFESNWSSSHFAELYKQHGLTGGHAIMLDAGDESKSAAIEALKAFPGGLQVGGGINVNNASTYIEVGASHVIVTSYIFIDGKLILDRLKDLVRAVGRKRLVLDLSCRKKNGKYAIVTNRWQTFTDVFLNESIDFFAEYADELLIHGVDVEGKRLGIDEELVALLGRLSTIPVTYAGGVTTLEDLELIKSIGMGRVDVTVGSSLDIFGGNLPFSDVVTWHSKNKTVHPSMKKDH